MGDIKKLPTQTVPEKRGPGRPRRRTYDEIVAANELIDERRKRRRQRARAERAADRRASEAGRVTPA